MPTAPRQSIELTATPADVDRALGWHTSRGALEGAAIAAKVLQAEVFSLWHVCDDLQP